MRLNVKNKLLISHLLAIIPLLIIVFSLNIDFDFKNAYYLFVSFALAITLSFVASLYITKPLDFLKDNMNKISRLNFKDVKPIKSGDEFELLFNEFSKMSRYLNHYINNFNYKNKKLDAIISSMQSAVIISNPQGTIKRTNKKAEELLSWCPCVKNSKFASTDCLRDLNGTSIPIEKAPNRRALNEKYSNYLLEAYNSKTKKRAILRFSGTPLSDNAGNNLGSIVVFLDITKEYLLQKRLKRMVKFEKSKSEHLSILHNVSLLLNKEKDMEKILSIVLKAAVDITKARIGIILQKKNKNFEQATLCNFLNKKNTSITIAEEDIHKSLGGILSNKIFEEKQSIRIANFSTTNKKLFLTNLPYPVKALMLTPILDEKQNIIGILILLDKINGRRFSIENERATQILSAHASVAINNSKSFEKEHRIAQILQKSLLPSKPLPSSLTSCVDISLTYKPATKDCLVGGDFYDFFNLEKNQTACIIADVNGKGIEAAAITSLVRNTIKAFAYEGHTPDIILKKTNKVLFNQTEDSSFITAIYGVLDLTNGFFAYSNAGHPPPLHYRYNENNVFNLNNGSTPLGLLADENYDLHSTFLKPNDSLVLYTDGLIEGRHNGHFFGEQGLTKSILSHAPLPVNIANRILNDVEEFTDGQLHDDIALLVLKIKKIINKKEEIKRVVARPRFSA